MTALRSTRSDTLSRAMGTVPTSGSLVLLTRLAREVFGRSTEEVLGIRLKQYILLRDLADHGGAVAQQALCGTLHLDPNNLVLMLNEVEGAGFAERRLAVRGRLDQGHRARLHGHDPDPRLRWPAGRTGDRCGRSCGWDRGARQPCGPGRLRPLLGSPRAEAARPDRLAGGLLRPRQRLVVVPVGLKAGAPHPDVAGLEAIVEAHHHPARLGPHLRHASPE